MKPLTLKEIKKAYYKKGKKFILTHHAIERANQLSRKTSIKDIHNVIKTIYKIDYSKIPRPNKRGIIQEENTCKLFGYKLNGQLCKLAVKISIDGYLVILTVISDL